MRRADSSGIQLSFFGDEPPEIPAAEVDESLFLLAERLGPGVRLGTCSWSFPGWKGLVWGRDVSKSRLSRDGLVAYARHPLLTCVGLDRTFYSILTESEYARYGPQVPDHFRFVAKAHQDCTVSRFPESGFFGRERAGQANPRFLDPHFAVEELIEPFVEGLGARAGVLLFQIPPVGRSLSKDPPRFNDRLFRFLEELPPKCTYAVELRNSELFTNEYLEVLRGTGAVHCLNVHPSMPPVHLQQKQWGSNRGPVLVRWMLHSSLTYEQARLRHQPFDRLVDEDPDVRFQIVEICREGSSHGQPVYVLANNKAEGSAPLTLVELARVIASETRRSGR